MNNGKISLTKNALISWSQLNITCFHFSKGPLFYSSFFSFISNEDSMRVIRLSIM